MGCVGREKNVLTTISLVVFCASIAVFFAQEFGRVFKKILAIPGAKLLLPLFLASSLIIIYEEIGHWLLLRVQITLHQLIFKLDTVVPFETGSISLTRIISLFIIGSLPIWVSHWSALSKKNQEPHAGTYWIGLVLWIFAAVLLTVA